MSTKQFTLEREPCRAVSPPTSFTCSLSLHFLPSLSFVLRTDGPRRNPRTGTLLRYGWRDPKRLRTGPWITRSHLPLTSQRGRKEKTGVLLLHFTSSFSHPIPTRVTSDVRWVGGGPKDRHTEIRPPKWGRGRGEKGEILHPMSRAERLRLPRHLTTRVPRSGPGLRPESKTFRPTDREEPRVNPKDRRKDPVSVLFLVPEISLFLPLYSETKR